MPSFFTAEGREKSVPEEKKNSLLLLPPFFWLNALMSFGVLGTYGKTKRTGVHRYIDWPNKFRNRKDAKKRSASATPALLPKLQKPC